MSKWVVYGGGGETESFSTRKAAEAGALRLAKSRAGGRKLTTERTKNRTLIKAGSSVLGRCELSEREFNRRDSRPSKWWQ